MSNFFEDHRYIKHRKIGEGAYGKVYLANDTIENVWVAIKMIEESVYFCPYTKTDPV